MSDIQLYIDPACMLSKVPYKVPNNTHYVTLERYELLQAENERLRKLFAETERLMLIDGEYEALKAGTYARLTAEVEYWKKGCER